MPVVPHHRERTARVPCIQEATLVASSAARATGAHTEHTVPERSLGLDGRLRCRGRRLAGQWGGLRTGLGGVGFGVVAVATGEATTKVGLT